VQEHLANMTTLDRPAGVLPPGNEQGARNGLGSLADPALDPLFWRAERLGATSAWWRHVPFAHWIVAAARPAVLVELGTHAGVSYSAFCLAVQRLGLATNCHAVDTWEGDEHAGRYADSVYDEFRAYHDARFGRFSSLIRSTFDAALNQMEDGSIDLLHIDGLHTYIAVRDDFKKWLPKLSASAVVLFHDVNERSGDFGVWKLWAELVQLYPSFTFLHSHGLGVLAVGAHAPEAVLELCRTTDRREVAAIRDRFAMLGERWLAETNEQLLAVDLGQQMERKSAIARDEIARLGRETARLGREVTQASARALRAEIAAAQIASAHETVLASTAWRVTGPVRRLAARVPRPLRRLLRGSVRLAWRVATFRLGLYRTDAGRIPAVSPANPTAAGLQTPRVRPAALAVALPVELSAVAPRGRQSEAPRVVFISGEVDTPGHSYRVERPMATLAGLGAEVTWMTPDDTPERLDEIRRATVLVIWRATWSDGIAACIAAVHEGGGLAAFDIDDLMVDPELARLNIIDGIRTQDLTEEMVRDHYVGIRRTLDASDLCLTTTEELASHARRAGLPTYVLLNGFDHETLARARLSARRRRQVTSDGLVRIGYAAGSRTHQRDFAMCADAVAEVMRLRPEVRLVGFQPGDGSPPIVNLAEFPVFAGLEEQIELRRFVPLEDLPDEIARFDINLAPLEPGNPFCEAKSELKFFEAAMVDVPSVVSATGPFRRAIRDGETGFLATTTAEWRTALLRLVDDAKLRREIAVKAQLSVLWRFGPELRRERLVGLLEILQGERRGARAFALELRQREAANTALPHIPPHEPVFEADQFGTAEVTVMVPLFNYAGFVVEALETVRAQTLAALDLVIVDDCSTDDGLAVAVAWAKENAGRFNRIVVLHNTQNAGLAFSRNAGFAAAETPYVLPLDADNRLRPGCAAACLALIRSSGAAFAYPQVQEFGQRTSIIGAAGYDPMRLQNGNYIDAMALVSRAAWSAAGGYDHIRHGWEDFDFWCRLAELGLFGAQVPGAPLAEYRAHGNSMLGTTMAAQSNIEHMVGALHERHPWLTIATPVAVPTATPPS
jgi:glycosyltransferase involved in cell wall biosynthesis